MFDESAAAVVKELPRFEPHVPRSIQILNHPFVSSLPLHTDQPFLKVNLYVTYTYIDTIILSKDCSVETVKGWLSVT